MNILKSLMAVKTLMQLKSSSNPKGESVRYAWVFNESVHILDADT